MEKGPLATLIDVTQLMKEPVGSSRNYDISGVIDEEIKGFVEGKVKLTHLNQGVLVQCKLTTEVELVCSRCLNTFSLPISYTAEEEFIPVAGVSGDLEGFSSEQPEEFTIGDNNILDLSELIRQYTLLNLPMKPLCKLDCVGIN